MKLYRSAQHPGQWVAYGPGLGWVVFPAREHGWDDRRPARGLDPVHLREVPATLAGKTGITLESPDCHFPHVCVTEVTECTHATK